MYSILQKEGSLFHVRVVDLLTREEGYDRLRTEFNDDESFYVVKTSDIFRLTVDKVITDEARERLGE
jgi:hypothetical protein